MSRTVLIAGATGFIGRNMVDHFLAMPGIEIVAVVHDRPAYEAPGVTWRQGDLRDRDFCRDVVQGVDWVIQAAATTSGSHDILNDPAMHVTDNAVMNSYLFREAARCCRHLIFFSCSIMYESGDAPRAEADFDANIPLHPHYFGAGHTKLYLERLCEFYAEHSNCRFTVARHSNVYGPGDKFDLIHSHVFGATVTKVMTASEGHITLWGKGSEKRDMLHVRDLCNFVERAFDRQPTPYGLYNVGSGKAIAIRDLAKRIITVSGRSLEIRFDPDGPTIDTTLSLNCDKANRELGWAPAIGLDEGISQTLDWWRSHVAPTYDR